MAYDRTRIVKEGTQVRRSAARAKSHPFCWATGSSICYILEKQKKISTNNSIMWQLGQNRQYHVLDKLTVRKKRWREWFELSSYRLRWVSLDSSPINFTNKFSSDLMLLDVHPAWHSTPYIQGCTPLLCGFNTEEGDRTSVRRLVYKTLRNHSWMDNPTNGNGLLLKHHREENKVA